MRQSRSVWDAIELGADRIGHGIAVSKDKELKAWCAAKQIPLEMCPSSNLQTRAVKTWKNIRFWNFWRQAFP
mgnify:CR=1 FL=1